MRTKNTYSESQDSDWREKKRDQEKETLKERVASRQANALLIYNTYMYGNTIGCYPCDCIGQCVVHRALIGYSEVI